MIFMQRVLGGVPLFVWPLLALLIVLGWLSSRDRETPIWPLLFLPFLALTGLPKLLAMPDQSTAWISFLAAYLLGAFFGRRLQSRRVNWRRASRVSLRGEWWSLAAMLLIFWTNFAEGMLSAIAPDLVIALPAKAAIPALKGLGSGLFLGRVLAVLTAPDISKPPTQSAQAR